MKKLFITLGRERDLIRYSEKSDLKDAKEISEEDAVSLFQKNFYSEEKAIEFIESVKDNPFNNWCQWREIMAEEKKYSGYGYHGGGRKATGIKRVSICISGQPEQVEELKKMAAQEEKTVSAFILEKTGVGGIK